MSATTQGPLEELTPERAAEIADHFAERWKRDFELVFRGVAERTGLTLQEVITYYMVTKLNNIEASLLEGQDPKYHPDCIGCQREKEFHEMQWEMMKLSIRAMKEEHEDWKDEPDHRD